MENTESDNGPRTHGPGVVNWSVIRPGDTILPGTTIRGLTDTHGHPAERTTTQEEGVIGINARDDFR